MGVAWGDAWDDAVGDGLLMVGPPPPKSAPCKPRGCPPDQIDDKISFSHRARSPPSSALGAARPQRRTASFPGIRWDGSLYFRLDAFDDVFRESLAKARNKRERGKEIERLMDFRRNLEGEKFGFDRA